MPMLTTLRTRLPVWPVHWPERTRSAKSAILREHGVHLGDDVLAVDLDDRALGRAQRDVQDGAVLGDVDLLAPEHRVDAVARGRRAAASATSRRSVSSVRRFFE